MQLSHIKKVLLVLFILLISTSLLSSPTYATYVLQWSEDFEDQDLTGWTGDAESNIAITSDYEINGSYALRSNRVANGNAQIYFSPNVSNYDDKIMIEYQITNRQSGNPLLAVSEIGGSFKRWTDHSDTVIGGDFECFDQDSNVDGDNTDPHHFQLFIDWSVDLMNCSIDGSVTNTDVDISAAQNKEDDWRFLSGHSGSGHDIVIDDFKLWEWDDSPPADSCTYSGSGDHTYTGSDNCVITSSVNFQGNDVLCTGSGTVTVGSGGSLTNFATMSAANSCSITAANGGTIG